LFGEIAGNGTAVTELVGGASGLGWVAVKALLMFAVVVAGLRLGERRTLAQLGAFDFAVAIAVGAIIGRTATSPSTSFATGAVALVTLLVAHRLVSALRRRGWLGGLVDSPPRVLVAAGRIRDDELSRAGLTVGDLYALLREHQVARLEAVEVLLYETRGKVTIVRRGEDIGPVTRAGLDAAGYPRKT
jgi:uncharacterized membrane protein YcaP (DUF421 family)